MSYQGEGASFCEDVERFDLEPSNDSDSEEDFLIENEYYTAKDLKKEDPKTAITTFETVLQLDSEKRGKWAFKALKQIIKLQLKLKNYEEMETKFEELLTLNGEFTRNLSQKFINSILKYISSSGNDQLLQTFYESTLKALKNVRKDNSWFKIGIKLGKLCLDQEDYQKLEEIIKQLHQFCKTDDGEDDKKQENKILEIYALEIQMYTRLKRGKKLKELYEKSLCIVSAVPHPFIKGVIKECGGKIYLHEGDYEKAYKDFYDAFKSYDESGSPERTKSLKYLLLANMLMNSEINPFDSQEAKPHEYDPEIQDMRRLVSAHQNQDLGEFVQILQTHQENVMGDPFIKENIKYFMRIMQIK